MIDRRNGEGAERATWLLGLAMVGLLALSVSACNTAEGFGRDVQAAGGAVSDTAEDVEDELD